MDERINAPLADPPRYLRPGRVDRWAGVAMVALLRRGLGPSRMRLLEVRGRKSGTVYTLPVDPVLMDGKTYVVAPRGHTQWVRNAAAAGVVTLRRGREAAAYRVQLVQPAARPPILKAYLDGFHREVQRYFPVQAGAPVESFVALVDDYPVCELTQD